MRQRIEVAGLGKAVRGGKFRVCLQETLHRQIDTLSQVDARNPAA